MTVAIARRSGGELAEPQGSGWIGAGSYELSLVPVPLAAQPTRSIRAAWRERPYGRVRRVSVAAAHDGYDLYLRLVWATPSDAPNRFPDAAGVLFPIRPRAPLRTLGRPSAALALSYWQANRVQPVSLISLGPGLFQPGTTAPPRATAARHQGEWRLVLSYPLAGAFAVGKSARLGVALWDGSNRERAGLAAVTPRWLRLEISA